MTAFFYGVQKAGKSDGEIAVAVVDGIHGPDHEGLSAFLWKERKLGRLMLQIGQTDPEKPPQPQSRAYHQEGSHVGVVSVAAD